jgi:hypothetical protein
MKRWRMMLLSVCLLVSACSSTRDFYEAVYNTLQLQAKTKNPPDNSPYIDWPVSFQQYEAERESLLKSPVKSTKSSP